MANLGFNITKTQKNSQVETLTFYGVAILNGTVSVAFDEGVDLTADKIDAAIVNGDDAVSVATKWAAAAAAVTNKFTSITDNGDGSVKIVYNTFVPYDAVTVAPIVGITGVSKITNVGRTKVVDAQYIAFTQIGDVIIIDKPRSNKKQVVARMGCNCMGGNGNEVILAETEDFTSAKIAYDAIITAIVGTDTASAIALDYSQSK